MTNDKELVEVWRKQFDEWINGQFWADCFTGKDRAEYFKVWIAAKSTMPVIELPHSFLHHIDDDECYVGEQVHASLTAAGIKYTIGE